MHWMALALAAVAFAIPTGPVRAEIDSQCSAASYPPNLDMFTFVFFDVNGVAVDPSGAAMLDNFIKARAEIPQCPISIGGHADTSGSAAYNLTLSKRRAKAVARYLRQHGLRSPIWTVGYGETRPLVETGDGVREPQNRRAEIWMIPNAIEPVPAGWRLFKE